MTDEEKMVAVIEAIKNEQHELWSVGIIVAQKYLAGIAQCEETAVRSLASMLLSFIGLVKTEGYTAGIVDFQNSVEKMLKNAEDEGENPAGVLAALRSGIAREHETLAVNAPLIYIETVKSLMRVAGSIPVNVKAFDETAETIKNFRDAVIDELSQ